MNEHQQCPCQSGKIFQDCCQPFLMGKTFPDTPEQLMRSRYTAYSQANIDYIQETMKPPASLNFNADSAKQWALEVEWLGLKVISAPAVKEKTNIGFVEFIASFNQHGKRATIHELSEFHRLNGKWYYVRGKTPKISRNDPCPCGSNKKFKFCCQNFSQCY